MSGQEAGLNNELKQQIEAFQKEILPKIPKEVLDVLLRTTEEQVKSGIAEKALVGSESFTAAVDRDPATIGWNAVSLIAVNDDRERARRTAREAICHLYAPLPHPYYEYTMREQGFSEAADALLKLMPAGKLEAAVDAIPDECVDRLTINDACSSTGRGRDCWGWDLIGRVSARCGEASGRHRRGGR